MEVLESIEMRTSSPRMMYALATGVPACVIAIFSRCSPASPVAYSKDRSYSSLGAVATGSGSSCAVFAGLGTG